MRWAGVWFALVAGCAPPFDDAPALLESPRLIAVLVEPPEAAPGERVSLRAVAAGPAGLVPATEARWSLCTAPVPPTETGSVSSACLGDLSAAGPDGETLTVAVPANACALFGPETPPGDFRPRDPDATGGFYQPVRVDWSGQIAFAFVRLRCGAGRVATDVALEFLARYTPNQNPRPIDLVAGPERLVVRWPAGTREPFVRVDPEAQRVVDDVEAITVSWFVTAGPVATARVAGGEEGAEVERLDPAGAAVAFAVVRDSRGGAAVVVSP